MRIYLLPQYVLLLFLLSLIFSSCTGQKKSGKYDYLKNKQKKESGKASAKEPFETIDISVLDTTRNTRPPVVVKDDKDKTDNNVPITSRAIKKVIKTADSYMGTKYKYGGTSRSGIDCSGLMMVAYLSINKKIPRTSSEQSKAGKSINKKKIAPGDLVFFSSNNGPRINHVGLVTQVNGSAITFIHATVSKGVREDELQVGYWSSRYRKAVRL